MNIMNATPFFFICLLPITVLVIFSIVTLKKAWAEGKEIGMDVAHLKKVVINSAVVCIIPTFAIIVTLAVLIPSLGQFLPWFRLSVIGSAPYEILAANIALQQTGVEGGMAAEIPDSSFISIIWAMTFGCLSSLIVTTIFMKKLDNGLAKARGKNSIVGAAAACAMTAVLCAFAVPQLFNVANPSAIVGVVASGVIAAIFFYIRKKGGPAFLRDFSFPLSMIGAMIVVTIFNFI